MDLIYSLFFATSYWTSGTKQKEVTCLQCAARVYTMLYEYSRPTNGPASRLFARHRDKIVSRLKKILFDEVYDESGFPYYFLRVVVSLFCDEDVRKMFIAHNLLGLLIQRAWIAIRTGKHDKEYNPSRITVKIIDECVL